MRDFAEENAPGLFDIISILREDDRLSKDSRRLQEQRAVVLLHTLAYFRLVAGSHYAGEDPGIFYRVGPRVFSKNVK